VVSAVDPYDRILDLLDRLSSAAGAIDQPVADVPRGLGLVPLEELGDAVCYSYYVTYGMMRNVSWFIYRHCQ
jgi:hypothetical protein